MGRARCFGLCLALALGAALAWASIAQAHVTNVSRSNVVIDGAKVRYLLDLAPVDLAVAAKLIPDAIAPLTLETLETNRERLIQYTQERVLVFGDGQSCPVENASLGLQGFPQGVNLSLMFACPAEFQELLIQYLMLAEVDTHHATVGRLVGPAGVTDFTLSGDSPELTMAVSSIGESAFSQAKRFFVLGIEHILIGYDHILFLLGLIVASLRWRYLISVITMFTVAHTTTLLLAAFGWVALPSKLVESVIALSIAYVALENLLGKGLRWRWAVTFGFGLVHGLGFASVLADLTQGAEAHVASLLTFNLGVEAGQLLIVSAVLPVLLLFDRYKLHAHVQRFASAGILLMALYWFGERAIWG